MAVTGGMIEVSFKRPDSSYVNADVWAEMGPDGWEFSVIAVDVKINFLEEYGIRKQAADQFFNA